MNTDHLTALEEALRENPEDSNTLQVYGDALQAIGDPRGQLAGIQRARSTMDPDDFAKAEAAILQEHGAALLGILGNGESYPDAQLRQQRGPFSGLPGYELTWEEGHVRSVRISEPYGASPGAGEVLTSLLGRPSAQFVRSIILRHYKGFSTQGVDREASERTRRRGTAVLNALTASPRPTLRELVVGMETVSFDAVGDDDARDLLSFGEMLQDLTPLWRAAPALHRVTLTGCAYHLGALEHPTLRHLELRHSLMPRQTLVSLADAELPALETLVLWLGASDYGQVSYRWRDLEVLCDPDRFPSLRNLGFVCATDTESILEMVLRSPILPQLASLDMRGGMIEDANALLRDPARVRHLERIDLRWNTLLVPDPELIAALPSVQIEPQRWDGHQDVPRFNNCME
ncbi:MAG: hypothetical protein AAGA48_28920 [Myxococcota bacterium]